MLNLWKCVSDEVLILIFLFEISQCYLIKLSIETFLLKKMFLMSLNSSIFICPNDNSNEPNDYVIY